MKKKKDLLAENHIVVFKDHNVRRVFHNNEWWFSIIDAIEALTESSNPRRYWSDSKHKFLEEERVFAVVRENRTTENDLIRYQELSNRLC